MSKIALRKVGSSFVATIPVDVIQELHLRAGQKLEVSKENGRIVLTPVTAELAAVTAAHEKVLEKYRAAFQRLADV
jgi:putative addiction module antidote